MCSLHDDANSAAAPGTQPQPIKGYRNLSAEEISLINMIKVHGEVTGAIVSKLESRLDIDKRWVSIGKTHLQQGLMALTRAIARPEGF